MWLVLLLMIPINIILNNSSPGLARVVHVTMLVMGVLSFGTGLVFYGRFKNVMDHEQTTFLGRPSDGKTARAILQSMGIAGVLLTLLGLCTMLLWP